MEYNAKITNRLKRTEGQVRGVLKMIEDEKDCKDVVTQLSAIRSSVDRAIGLIVAENLVECVSQEMEDGLTQEEAIQEAINLLVKSR
ncbi:metal-sensitive transcriptional regulator [Pisciglobus halotolerans]|uniref:DNA-binding transcriptional regulator, FrmR family n=1 Tax=Pisciglobus halotolerans TaxID=745365 RepID=A0A1I3D084_9LACT|nr:metal-sensitive transcriptional regulator [Pisciglobus halotolerans]SFH80125.1 DNA-binding transcriptional regulator, FrmR family [Pisciglobus halotolerans]